jgi:hypothetical protein
MPHGAHTVDLDDEAATVAFAEDIAACIAPGDLVALCGGLGVGKTTFARALIRAVADDEGLEVPSPTFTLVQTYAGGRLNVSHFDLYRLAAAAELDEIGFDDALADGAVVVEWAERAASRLPANRLDVTIAIAIARGGSARQATVSGGPDWLARLARSRAARDFVERAGLPRAARRHLKGDASTRRYERVRAGGRGAVLMDWPPQPATDDPRAPFRARDVRAFVAVDGALRAAGLSAPEIHAADMAAGFLLLEDLGSVGVVEDDAPVAERYDVAIEVLATIHSRARPGELPLPDGTVHRLPLLAGAALAAEIDLFAEWYPVHATGKPLDANARAGLTAIWARAFARLDDAERSWVLFDMQSPNLIWLADREGPARLGLLDFQDMFLGPAAYDVASLCQDARATIPAALESALRARYVALRRASDAAFDAGAFAEAYAVLAALRAFKNLGVFARLADGFGERGYLGHVPRMREYLVRNFADPVLSDLAVWYERHLPPP